MWDDQWSFSSGISHSGSSGSLNPFCVFSPDTECIIRIDMLSSWHNPHVDSLTYGTRAITVGKAKCKPLELLLPRKVNQK